MRRFASAVVLVLSASAAFAQATGHEHPPQPRAPAATAPAITPASDRPIARATRTENAPRIDGALDDPAWSKLAILPSENVRRQPGCSAEGLRIHELPDLA